MQEPHAGGARAPERGGLLDYVLKMSVMLYGYLVYSFCAAVNVTELL